MSSLDDPKVLGSTRLGFADEREVDVFVEKLGQFERGELDADAWRAFRLVHGTYGQRQDQYTMLRTKIPQGILTPAQILALADVAESWSNGKGHLTTRQNVQFHFMKLADVESAMRRLADSGMTTREACGNCVRNITTCPYAGTAKEEPFDITPYAEALTRHLLRGTWSSTLPRKFKIAFGGCCGTDCTMAAINDLGFLAAARDGRPGFRLRIGGGTAAMPRSAFLADEFLPAEDLLEAAEAVVRVFHRVGDRQNRHKARLKYAIEKLGRDGFLADYRSARETIRAEGGRPYALPPQPAPPTFRPGPPGGRESSPAFPSFLRDNVRAQKQEGFSTVTVRVPLGDVTAGQWRALAGLAELGEGELRTTHEQNLVLRYVPDWRVAEVWRALDRIGLGKAGVRTVVDATSCPGAMSCKLAVTASRGLAELLADHLEADPELAAKARDLTIKVSGCPNGCGQHHVAGLGFQGGVRKVDGKAVPQYHLYVGGGVGADGAGFGRLAAKIPARRAPAAVRKLIELYDAARSPGEKPDDFFARVALDRVQAVLAEHTRMEAAEARPEDFVDLGEERAFVLATGKGECAM